MKLRLFEKPKMFDAAEFTAEMVLGTEPLAEGIHKSSRESVIIPEKWIDSKGHARKRSPRERILEHWYYVKLPEGEGRRKIFIGDFILKDAQGNYSVLSKDRLDSFEVTSGDPVPARRYNPEKQTITTMPELPPPPVPEPPQQKPENWRHRKKRIMEQQKREAQAAAATPQ